MFVADIPTALAAIAGTVDTCSVMLSQEPPSSVRLFRAGENDSTKGTFLFDDVAARAVMKKYHAMNRKVTFDYDHGSLNKAAPDPAQAAKCAGAFDLELRDGELYAVNISWTPAAADAIRNGEWLYISPAFTRTADMRPNWLINVALTNQPSLHDMTPLIAANIFGDLLEDVEPVALGAVGYHGYPVVDSGKWDASAAVAGMRKWASSDGSGDADKMDWSKYAQGFGYVSGDGKNFGDYHLPHHKVVGGKLATDRAGVAAAAGAVDGARGASIPADVKGAVKRHLEQHYHQFKEKAPWEAKDKQEQAGAYPGKDPSMKLSKYSDLPSFIRDKKTTKAKCLKAMGISAEDFDKKADADEDMSKKHMTALEDMGGDDADGDDDGDTDSANVLMSVGIAVGLGPDAAPRRILASVGDLNNNVRELCALTGKQSFAAALGVVEAWQQTATANADIVEKYHALQAKTTDAEMLAIVDRAEKDGRFAPKVRDSMLKRARAYEQKNAGSGVEWLSSLADMTPVQPALANNVRSLPTRDAARAALPSKEEQLNAAGQTIAGAEDGGEYQAATKLSAEQKKIMVISGFAGTEKEWLEQHNALAAEEHEERLSFSR